MLRNIKIISSIIKTWHMAYFINASGYSHRARRMHLQSGRCTRETLNSIHQIFARVKQKTKVEIENHSHSTNFNPRGIKRKDVCGMSMTMTKQTSASFWGGLDHQAIWWRNKLNYNEFRMGWQSWIRKASFRRPILRFIRPQVDTWGTHQCAMTHHAATFSKKVRSQERARSRNNSAAFHTTGDVLMDIFLSESMFHYGKEGN